MLGIDPKYHFSSSPTSHSTSHSNSDLFGGFARLIKWVKNWVHSHLFASRVHQEQPRTATSKGLSGRVARPRGRTTGSTKLALAKFAAWNDAKSHAVQKAIALLEGEWNRSKHEKYCEIINALPQKMHQDPRFFEPIIQFGSDFSPEVRLQRSAHLRSLTNEMNIQALHILYVGNEKMSIPAGLKTALEKGGETEVGVYVATNTDARKLIDVREKLGVKGAGEIIRRANQIEKKAASLGNAFPDKAADELWEMAVEIEPRDSYVGQPLSSLNIANITKIIHLLEKRRSSSIDKELHYRESALPIGISLMTETAKSLRARIELYKGLKDLPQERPAALNEAIVEGNEEALKNFIESEEDRQYLVGIQNELGEGASAEKIVELAQMRKINVEGLRVMFPGKSHQELWDLAVEAPRVKGASEVNRKNIEKIIQLLEGDFGSTDEREFLVRFEPLIDKVMLERNVDLSSAFQRKELADSLRGYLGKGYASIHALYNVHVGVVRALPIPEDLAEALKTGDKEGIEKWVFDPKVVGALLAEQKKLAQKGKRVLPIEVVIMAHRNWYSEYFG